MTKHERPGKSRLQWGLLQSITTLHLATGIACGRINYEPQGDYLGPGRVALLYDDPWLTVAIGLPLESAFAPTHFGPISSFTIQPALPSGLVFNSDNGEITGTPTNLTEDSQHTIRAQSSSHSDRFELSVKVLPTLSVDSLLDSGSTGEPSDGVCESTLGGCTLRAAIEEANAMPGQQLILLPAGTIELSLGQLEVTESLALSGRTRSTSILDAGRLSRIFNITAPDAAFDMTRLSLINGLATAGGAIQSSSRMPFRVSDTEFWGNEAISTGPGGTTGGGAIAFQIFGATTSASFSRCSFAGNLANRGGAIRWGNPGEVFIQDSVFERNDASHSGRAAYFAGGQVQITRSAFLANTGSGAVLTGLSSSLAVNNTSFIENLGSAACIVLENEGTLDLRSSTFYNNTNTTRFGAAVSVNNQESASFVNTIYLENEDADGRTCWMSTDQVLSYGGNILDGSGCGLDQESDILNATLGQVFSDTSSLPLGSSRGLAPNPDGIAAAQAIDAYCPRWDQGRRPRPNGDGQAASGCDSGAFEYVP